MSKCNKTDQRERILNLIVLNYDLSLNYFFPIYSSPSIPTTGGYFISAIDVHQLFRKVFWKIENHIKCSPNKISDIFPLVTCFQKLFFFFFFVIQNIKKEKKNDFLFNAYSYFLCLFNLIYFFYWFGLKWRFLHSF